MNSIDMQTNDNWWSDTSQCLIPGALSPSGSANFPANLVCNGFDGIFTQPLTSSTAPHNTYGTIYVFKDMSDNLYVTAAIDGANSPIDFPGQPMVAIPALDNRARSTQLFAWPSVQINLFPTSTNYNDQNRAGR